MSTIGSMLLIAALPFRYSGERLAVLWLVEAEALLLIGTWTKEVVFRRFGMLASVVASVQMIGVNAAEVCGRRMDGENRATYISTRMSALLGRPATQLLGHSLPALLGGHADLGRVLLEKQPFNSLDMARCRISFLLS